MTLLVSEDQTLTKEVGADNHDGSGLRYLLDEEI
jgi:hypothetical protein